MDLYEILNPTFVMIISPPVQIHIEIPHTKVNFRSQNKEERIDNSQLIRGMFAISQRPSMLLQGQHALITFEEKKGTHEFIY